MSEEPKHYWIQRQAPAGNWVDFIGYPIGTTEEQSRDALDQQQSADTEENFRLVLRTDTPIA